jgi:hypothetical protein
VCAGVTNKAEVDRKFQLLLALKSHTFDSTATLLLNQVRIFVVKSRLFTVAAPKAASSNWRIGGDFADQ